MRYKLDQATEHILVDEAQDTNLAQWAIVDALADEFFAGEGARGDAVRTLFTVGDYKQAIFGFQGTDPIYFRCGASVISRRCAVDAATSDAERRRAFDATVADAHLPLDPAGARIRRCRDRRARASPGWARSASSNRMPAKCAGPGHA